MSKAQRLERLEALLAALPKRGPLGIRVDADEYSTLYLAVETDKAEPNDIAVFLDPDEAELFLAARPLLEYAIAEAKRDHLWKLCEETDYSDHGKLYQTRQDKAAQRWQMIEKLFPEVFQSCVLPTKEEWDEWYGEEKPYPDDPNLIREVWWLVRSDDNTVYDLVHQHMVGLRDAAFLALGIGGEEVQDGR